MPIYSRAFTVPASEEKEFELDKHMKKLKGVLKR
jgi:hypothetical protein